LRRDGSFLFADLGVEHGGVFSLSRSGEIRPFLEEVDGVALPPSNFVFEDARSRVWITVSTRLVPRARGYRHDVADGFIVVVDDKGARIVADGLGYTNEAVIDARGEWLYVNETFSRLTSRFPVRSDGRLGPREVFAEYGAHVPTAWRSMLSHLWVVSIISNRLLRVADNSARRCSRIRRRARGVGQAAYLAGELSPALDGVKSARLRTSRALRSRTRPAHRLPRLPARRRHLCLRFSGRRSAPAH
jgi:hypothetical protein